MSNESATVKYLTTFFVEKEIDAEHVFEVRAFAGTTNWIPAGCVIEAVMAAPPDVQEQIATNLRKIDFVNGDVMHFLEFLAKGMAQDF